MFSIGIYERVTRELSNLNGKLTDMTLHTGCYKMLSILLDKKSKEDPGNI
jgi:hypothetical protein